MSEQSEKWDSQWSKLLTHCYGEVEANAEFKSSLLAELKRKTAENRSAESEQETTDDAHWSKLLTSAYPPCEPNASFKSTLLSQLKARQSQVQPAPQQDGEEEAIQTILTQSYQPVAARREFQTRLLDNLKERQRSNTAIRAKSRRRVVFMSAMTSMAAAAAVLFVVWVSPMQTNPVQVRPQAIDVAAIANNAPSLPIPEPKPIVQFDDYNPADGSATTIPAAYFPDEPTFNYSVASAFAQPALPPEAVGLKNMEMDTGDGWRAMDETQMAQVRPGIQFRSAQDGAGHLGFSDHSMISMGPDTLLEATEEGFSVLRGVALISVPESTENRFRLHFPERDIAIEPGTQLALLVESRDDFAEGGSPAPLVMVVEDQDTEGGLALARGKNGIGPLFARYIYSLDNYVTPNLPGRPLCEVECEDLEKMFKMQMLSPDSQNNQSVPPYQQLASFNGAPNRPRITPAGFTRQGNKWVADSYKNEATQKIRYLSDSYFGLANERRDLARGLALGAEVIVDAGDGVFYEIYK